MDLLKDTLNNSHKSRLPIYIAFLMLPLLLCASIAIQPPQSIPTASSSIFTPANGSTVCSPIELEYEIICQPNITLRIELIDQSQTLIYRKLVNPMCQSAETISLNETIFFDITPKSKFARLTISIHDAEKVPVAVTSSFLNLSTNQSSILTTRDNRTNFFVTSPASPGYTSGGELQLSGWARVRSDSPIILELLSTSGGLIASRQLAIPEHTIGDYFNFQTSIPYRVSRIQDVYLVIRQFGNGLPGNFALERTTFQIGP